MEVEAKVESENWWEVKQPPRVRPVKKVDFWEAFGGMESGPRADGGLGVVLWLQRGPG